MSRGQIDIDVNSYPNPHTQRRTRESHLYRYRKEKARKKRLFLRLWNRLPADVVESKSLVTFQSELLSYLVKNR